VVKLDPLMPLLYLQLANFYLYAGQFETSIESFITYTRLLPNDEYTYNRLGIAYYRSGNFTRASEMLNKSLCINPNISDAAENLRISQREQGNSRAAVVCRTRINAKSKFGTHERQAKNG
jgi:tetratricopeptide (TPR) repeat protein